MSKLILKPIGDPVKLGDRMVVFNEVVGVEYTEEELAEQKAKEQLRRIEDAKLSGLFDRMEEIGAKLDALAKEAESYLAKKKEVCPRCNGTNRIWDNGDMTHCHDG